MDAVPSNVYQVGIKVLHKETNLGLADLLVVLLDLDAFRDPETSADTPAVAPGAIGVAVGPVDVAKLLANFASYNRLFSGITDADGKAAATISAVDFNTGKESEKKPDLLLLVFAPEEPGLDFNRRLLYRSLDFRVNAGTSEAFIVRLGSALLKEKEIAIPVPPPDRTVDDSIDAKIAAYQARSSGDDQFHAAMLDAEKGKTEARQATFTQSRDQFKTLFTPLPLNAVGSNYSTYVSESEAVKDKFADHFVRETTKATATIDHHVAANTGIEVSFVLNKRDRDALGFDAAVLAAASSGPAEADKTFSNIQSHPVLQPVLAKMNAAGADNVVLTSNNPILKKCQIRSDDTLCATDSLGLGSAGPVPTAGKAVIGFADLPAPAQAYINGNDGGEAKLVVAFKITDTANAVSYEVRLLADVVLHFDADGVNTDDNSPMRPEDIADYVKKAITDIRSLNVSAQTTAAKPSQDSVNSSIDKFSLRKGPAELPSYHDFMVLNIAFGHIWKQLTDDAPAQLAAQAAQQANTRGFTLSNSYANVSHLLSDFQLGVSTMTNLPESVVSNFDITYEEWNALDLLARNKISECSTAIDFANKGLMYQPASTELVTHLLVTSVVARPAGYYNLRSRDAEQYVQKLKDQGELLIDYVRNGNGKSLHKILTDLDAALKANYAFTVFGADNTAKAVNFGLLNTYRQKWEPVAYQVGNLVKSIPLAPKQERKYSLKTVFNRKRTEEEARKNSSALTQEQNTRVRHQPSQVVDLYKGEPLGCHYSNGIWVSWVGFLSFSAASTPAWWVLMVEMPAIGAA